MKEKQRLILTEAAEKCGLSPDLILRFISLSWVSPADPDQTLLDDEDISRARLIAELQRDFGINDAAVPVILQLLDQLHMLHQELRHE
jgi:chaperone modulatory protein CbpM